MVKHNCLLLLVLLVHATTAFDLHAQQTPALAPRDEWTRPSAKSHGFQAVAGYFSTVLPTLTLEQKIGQLFVVSMIPDNAENQFLIDAKSDRYRTDVEYVRSLIKNYQVGGVIFLGINTLENQHELTKEFQRLSSVPLLIALDAEWGLTMRLSDALRFPRNQALGAVPASSEYLVYQMGCEVGRQCKALGVHMNLAPVVDCNNNPANPVINDRSFGCDPVVVARKGALFAHGLQQEGVLACIKHFPGHGDTTVDSHYDLPRLMHTRKLLREYELYPFMQLMNSGVSAVMSAHLEVPALEPREHMPFSLSPALGQMIRTECRFDGLVVTDGLDMHGVLKHHEPGQLELDALRAGNDILLCSTDVPRAIATIKKAIEDGLYSERELDEHVTRVLTAKAWAGCTRDIPAYNAEHFFSDHARTLKKELYRSAITVVRDDAHVIHAMGDTIAVSCIQIGSSEHLSVFNTVLARHGVTETQTLSGESDDAVVRACVANVTSDVVIVSLLGMNRWPRDSFGITPATVRCLQELKSAGKKVCVVVFGNAYSLPLLADADTLIMAYEDDNDAQKAAAEVLRGIVKSVGVLPILN